MERGFGASSLCLPAPCMVPVGAQAGRVFCPLVRASGHQGEACAQMGAHSVSRRGAVGQLCPVCAHVCSCVHVGVCFFFLPQGTSHQCRPSLLGLPLLPAPFSPPLIFAPSWQSFHPPLPALIFVGESMRPSPLEAASLGFKSTWS